MNDTNRSLNVRTVSLNLTCIMSKATSRLLLEMDLTLIYTGHSSRRVPRHRLHPTIPTLLHLSPDRPLRNS